jgi:RNA polymerase sigma-70 factor (ECF subfamily)
MLAFGTRSSAEDAVQEALARAWERSERGEGIESLAAWVTVVATNLMGSGLRRLWVERRAEHRLEPGAGGSAQEDSTAGLDDLIDLRQALASLPRRQRAAVVLRYYLDLDVAHVARALKVSEGTAKTTLHRARRSLAAALGEPNREEARDVAGH